MSIRVLYFASLKDAIGRSEDIVRLDSAKDTTVQVLWSRLNGEEKPLDRILCAVNMEYATAETRVHDGDEVAFFPPVTGG
jgi:sulfur-carrier protein